MLTYFFVTCIGLVSAQASSEYEAVEILRDEGIEGELQFSHAYYM
ncbi:MAG: hypothetical protein [Bacteriophage sp.]|nr:MAG: hypothetical protein [Bacteriophage sp.]